MFIDCPYCGYLVALDDALAGAPDDAPDGGEQAAPRCPNCAQPLRRHATAGPHDAEAALAPAGAPPPAADGGEDGRDLPVAGSPAPDPTPAAPPRVDDAPRPAAPQGVRPDVPSAAMQDSPPAPAQATREPRPADPVDTEAEIAAPRPGAQDAAVARPAQPAAGSATVAAAAGSRPRPPADEARPPDEAAGADPQEATGQADAGTPSAGAVAADAVPEAGAPGDAPAGPVSAAAASPRRRRAEALPSFARATRAPQAGRTRRRWEVAAAAALLLLLALQLLLSQRARLAADAQWRPALSAMCGVLRCTLPPWREPGAFRVLERDVRALAPGVLRVSARIRNEARWPQPWPALQLTLSDAHGRAVASRVFQPREYLGGAPTQPQLGSGQAMALRMDIVEPGPQAVAFTFGFDDAAGP